MSKLSSILWHQDREENQKDIIAFSNNITINQGIYNEAARSVETIAICIELAYTTDIFKANWQ